ILLSMCLIWFLVEKSRRKTHPVVGGIDRTKTLEHTELVELYSNSFSHCSRKARLVLAELGIEAKHHPIDLIETGWYQTISEEYLKVNPAGLVPTLVHEGHPVYESDDILAYAQSIAGDNAPELIPDDPELRDEMEHWLSFCAIVSSDIFGGMERRAGACIPGLSMLMFLTTIQYTPFSKMLVGFLFHPSIKSPLLFSTFKIFGLRRMLKLKPLREMIHTSRDHMGFHLETLNKTLAGRGQNWILGEQFSLADVTIGCMLLRLEETGWLDWFSQKSSISDVTRYYARLQQRPAWSKAISDHAHPVITQGREDLRIAALDSSLAALIYGPLSAARLSEEAATETA
ncbi:MAG: glutathione S-transferase family protein, partial [Pseudomonadota bacterium]